MIDSDDNPWVRTYRSAQERDATRIEFALNGAEIATLALPYTLEVNEIGPDYVLDTHTDVQNGEERVRIFRLHRRD